MTPPPLPRKRTRPEADPPRGRTRTLLIVGGVVAGSLAALFVVGYVGMTAGDAREAGQDRDAVRMDVGEFLAGWKEDPVALLGRLRGRRAELTGRLLAVDSAGGVVTAEIGAGPGHVFGEYVVVLFDGALRRELGGHPVGSTLTVQAVFGAPDRVPRGRAVKVVKAGPK